MAVVKQVLKVVVICNTAEMNGRPAEYEVEEALYLCDGVLEYRVDKIREDVLSIEEVE